MAKKAGPVTRTPQEIAKDAVDRYFAALTSVIPYDCAPGDVELITVALEIQSALAAEESNKKSDSGSIGATIDEREDDARQAGYLLGVEVGRRLGGVR